MADQATGGISVRFEQTGAEAVQKSVEALTEAVNSLTSQVANLTGGQKALVQSTEEVSRVQNQVSVSSGLADNALRRQLVSVSRLQGGVAALIPALGSTSYAFRRVAIAAGGLLTINPAFAALAAAAAAFGLALNQVRENAEKANEAVKELAATRLTPPEQTQQDVEARQGRIHASMGELVQWGGAGEERLDQELSKRQHEMEGNNIDIETLNKQADSLAKVRQQLKDARAELKNTAQYETVNVYGMTAMGGWGVIGTEQRQTQEYTAARKRLVDLIAANSSLRAADLAGADRSVLTGSAYEIAHGNISNRQQTNRRNREALNERNEVITAENEALESFRDAAKKSTEAGEAAKAAAEQEKQNAKDAEEAAKAVARRVQIQEEEDRRALRERFDASWDDETLQRELEKAQADRDWYRRQQENINKAGDGSEQSWADYRMNKQLETDMNAYIAQLQGEIEKRANAAIDIINPFQNFSSTQTDLEAHGADIGAGIGGSSMNEALQQLIKQNSYLRNIDENTRQETPATIGQ